MFKDLPPLSLADFANYPWQEVIKSTHPKTYWQYCLAFEAKATEEKKTGNTTEHAVCAFLSRLCTNLIHMAGQDDPFASLDDWLAAITNEQILLLWKLLALVEDPELRARIADILWTSGLCLDGNQKAESAKIAMESYLLSAKTLESANDWQPSSWRVKRAAQLATKIDGKKKTTNCQTVVDFIVDVIKCYRVSTEHEFLTGSFMQVWLDNLKDLVINPDYYAQICADKALIGERSISDDGTTSDNYHQNYYQSKAYRKIEAQWHKIAKDETARRQALIMAAEADVRYAFTELQRPNPSYAVVAGRLRGAIGELRKIVGTTERIQELRRELVKYEQLSMSQLIVVPYDPEHIVDIELQETARNLVKGKNLRDALYVLCFKYKVIQEKSYLKKQAEEYLEEGHLSNFFPMQLVDREGKTKAYSDPGNPLEEKMYRDARFSQIILGINFVLPACEQIATEYKPAIEELDFAFSNNPFVPQGRERLYARGFLAGLNGEWDVAVHLLIPQMENSLRHVLREKGYFSANLSSKMIEDDFNLIKILDLSEMENILGEDLFFDLKGLLVERMGSNLRNEVCHGLMDVDDFRNPLMAYLWWVVLYLCLYPSHQIYLKS
jgi:Domain of unknown function (DUF4209)